MAAMTGTNMIIQMSEYRGAPRPKNGAQAAARTNTAPAVVWMSNRMRNRTEAGVPEDAAIAEVHVLLDRIYALATQI
jgi:hypothetical protein